MLRPAELIFLIWYCMFASTTSGASCNNENCVERICSNSTDRFGSFTPRIVGAGQSRCFCPCTQQHQSGCGNLNRTNIRNMLPDAVPWVVAILMVDDILGIETNIYYRAGSLINPMIVLTAAHPFSETDPDKLLVRANMNCPDANEAHQDRRVSRIVIHENYKKKTLLNDIALLYLEERFEITTRVNVICLPPPQQNYDLQSCLVAGWGKDKFGESGIYQDSLKTIEIPIVPRDKCLIKFKRALGRTLKPDFDLHESVICAGGEIGIDTCEGDGGAPLVCPIKGTTDKYHQIGIVSWGIGCGGPIPGVYVNVPLFRNWIDQQLNR